jgi:hypothetical protein
MDIYDAHSVRKLLDKTLRTNSDFESFCHDFFPEVYHRFSSSMDRVQKTTILLQIIQDNNLITQRLREFTGRENGSSPEAVSIAQAIEPQFRILPTARSALSRLTAWPSCAALISILILGGSGVMLWHSYLSPSDQQLCEQACTMMGACGVPMKATADCVKDCINPRKPVFLSCVGSSSNDCGSLGICIMKQIMHDVCGNDSGPGGAGSCKAAAACEAACGASNAKPACQCPCWATMAPSKSINLIINNFCALKECLEECSGALKDRGAACFQCFALKCQAEHAQCESN